MIIETKKNMVGTIHVDHLSQRCTLFKKASIQKDNLFKMLLEKLVKLFILFKT